jgi:hypothetical protein
MPDESTVKPEVWGEIDSYLERGEILRAVIRYRRATGNGIADSKSMIGERFREKFPELWAKHRNICDEDWTE